MIEKLNQKLNQFYHFSFIFIMAATLVTIFYFWKLGFVDGSRNKELHKANYILEQMETKKPIEEVNGIVHAENAKSAIAKLDLLSEDLTKVNNLIEDKEFENIKAEIQNIKAGVANLISFPKVTKIISVFNEKMVKFELFVNQKKWRTLSRTTNRILEQTKGHINSKNLKGLIDSIEKDFAYMKNVTENSVLPRPEKSEIISRINNLQVEITMLSKYVDEIKFFENLISDFDKNLNSWLARISPELSYQKIQIEQIGRYYIMGLLGILVLTSLIFFGGFAFNRWHTKKAQQEFEKYVENFVSDGLIGGRVQDLAGFSNEFVNFTDYTTEYIDKRMSYGVIFQEALPLSSIMLDKNLKVIWANKQFCDDWQLQEDEINKDYLSWDFLSKLTNIGDNDPVLEALKHKVAGIYQIQIKPNDEAEVRPYEMFVSPVKFKNETRIMLFFYPLLSLQETITLQARSIVNPIEKTLDVINHGAFTAKEKAILEKEYEIADIRPLLEKFSFMVQKNADHNNQLFDQIEMLYQKLDKSFEITDEIEKTNFQVSENNTSQVQNLKAFKKHVIDLSSAAKMYQQTSMKELKLIEDSFIGFNSSHTKVNELTTMVKQLTSAMPKFGLIREEIKKQKTLMTDAKMRFAHSLAQMIHLKKLITDTDTLARFNNNYERTSTEFKNFDSITVDLEKRLVNLEVILSKTQMLVNDINQKIPSLDSKEDFNRLGDIEKDMQEFKKQINSMQGSVEQSEDEMIVHLKSLYLNTKSNIENSRKIASVLSERPKMIESHLEGDKTVDASSGANEQFHIEPSTTN